jgi:hypothetical protein
MAQRGHTAGRKATECRGVSRLQAVNAQMQPRDTTAGACFGDGGIGSPTK